MIKYLYIFSCVALLSCDSLLLEEHSDDAVVVFDQLWEEVDRHYSYFDNSNLDWDSVYSNYRPEINTHTTDQELFEIASKMLSTLNDPHTNLYTNKGVGGNVNYFSRFPINELDDISTYFSYYEQVNNALEYGVIKDQTIGYIKIRSFDGEPEEFEAFEKVIDSLFYIKGLVIDVRSNRGGLISNAEIILQNFFKSDQIVSQYRFRDGVGHDNFSEWSSFEIDGNDKINHLEFPIIVLTNRQTFSACEWFVMGANVLPQFQILGDTTGGGSGIPLLRELPNGWILRVSNSQMRRFDGTDFQFSGIYPDYPVHISASDALAKVDTILESAIQLLD
ncbi:MAG: S41 family peptidase [Reichenbachiella sp.]